MPATTLPNPLSRNDLDTSLRGDDPGSWGHSMANMTELILPLLETAGTRSIAEVGAYAGDFTAVLADWAAGSDTRVIAIDPTPQAALSELAAERSNVELIERTSLDALAEMELTDAIVLDGDHNYHTVSGELATIGERAPGAELPLVLLHDVAWPHARRDAYYAPDRIPAEYQDSIEEGVGVFPGESGVTFGGLPYKWAARSEGGERNGVLTALEDFLAGRDGVRWALVPIFFGLGVVWHEDAPYSDRVAALLERWDRDPILARLEGNRVRQLASEHVTRTHLHMAQERLAEQEAVLRMLRHSDSVKLASRLAAIRHRDEPSLTERIDSALRPPRGS